MELTQATVWAQMEAILEMHQMQTMQIILEMQIMVWVQMQTMQTTLEMHQIQRMQTIQTAQRIAIINSLI